MNYINTIYLRKLIETTIETLKILKIPVTCLTNNNLNIAKKTILTYTQYYIHNVQ